MKKSLTILASILFAAVFTFSFGQSSANLAQPQKVFVSSGTVDIEIRPIEVLHDPIKLLGIWADEPVPLSVYTEEEIAIQKDINQQLGKQYAYTYRHIPDEEIYDDNNANIPVELRNIDNEPITPYTWKVVQLRMTEADGSILNAQLRRPNWWIKHHGADRIGNMVRLSIHEMAIEGMAEVINIGANQIDTRVKSFDDDGNYTFRPVTGWFERVSADTWDYTFSNGEVIGSTPNHPFFSEDRQDYVAIGEMKIEERIKVKGEQTAKLVSKTKRATEGEKVYNLEIYRDHNFHVGEEGLLVHNSCADIFRNLCDIDPDLKVKIKPKLKPAGHKSDIIGQDKTKIQTKYGKDKVCFDDFGFPDFMPFVKKIGGATEAIVEIVVTGTSGTDINNANKKMAEELGLPLNTKFDGVNGYDFDGIKYTWHHHQDGKHMMLVPSDVNGVSHAGGAAMAREDLKGVLPDPWHTKNNFTTKCL